MSNYFDEPPQGPPPTIMLNDAYSDEEDSSDGDVEFSMSKSRANSFAPPSLHFNSVSPPPPPPPIGVDGLPLAFEDDDTPQELPWSDDILSMDEIDRLQQQRKQTTTSPLPIGEFRSSLRQSFSTNSRPLAMPPPPPLSIQSSTNNLNQTGLLLNTNVFPPSTPAAISSISAGSATLVTEKETIYGVTGINGEKIPYKYPIDTLNYPNSVTHLGQAHPATVDNIPKSPYLDYKLPQGRDLLHFQQVLTSVDEAIRQARSGQYSIKRTVKFIDQWCKQEISHLDAQTQLIASEAYKCGHSTQGLTLNPEQILQEKHYKLYCGYHSSRSEQYDEMHRTQRSLIAVFNAVEKELSFRRKRVGASKKLIVDLSVQAALLEHRIKKCYDDYKQYTTEKAKELAHVRKLEKECQSLLKQAKLALGTEKEEDEKPQQQVQEDKASKFKFLSSKLQHFKDKARVQLAGGPKEFCSELAVLSEQYQAAIEKGNQAITLYQQRSTKLLGTLALVEAERIVLLNFTISQFAKQAHLTEQPIGSLYHTLLFNTFEIDPQYDFQDYLRRHRTANGVPTLEPMEVYRLPCSPDDIRQMKLDVNPNSVFRVSLHQCMKIQTTDYPLLRFPRIMTVLIQGIRAANGITAEGIFRISHQKEELGLLRKQFEGGNYEIPPTITSPHAPAALFKEWLRELQDALIPTEYYTMWMNCAKSLGHQGGSNQHQHGGKPPVVYSTPSLTPTSPMGAQPSNSSAAESQIEAQILNLYSTLDEVNQNVIREIAVLVIEISHPLNQRINRMTVENLAIVFAPSFFRNPSDDPNEILLNSKNETKMTSLLLSIIGNKFGDLEALDMEYAMLPASQQLGGTSLTNPAFGGGGGQSFNTPSSPSPSFFNNGASNSSSTNSAPLAATNQPHPHPMPPQHTPMSKPSQHSHFAQPIPENAQLVPPPPSPSASPFFSPPPPPQPSTPMSSSASFFNSSGGPPPVIPPRRGTFIMPPGPIQRLPSQQIHPSAPPTPTQSSPPNHP